MTSSPPATAVRKVGLLHGTRTELLAVLASSADGLTSAEAARRLADVGPNEPVSTRQRAAIVQLGLFFANPLVIILLLSSIITALLGDILDASIIAILVLQTRV